MKRIPALLLTTALLLLCLAGCGGSSELRFGTGGVGGTYYAYGTALAQMISQENDQLTFSVKTTAGSAANLRLLREGFLQLAVVQSDMLSDAVNGVGAFESAGAWGGYAAIAGLYTEACQLVTAEGSGIASVSDLAGRRVSLGEKESGARKNAEEIMLSYGVSVRMIEASYLSFADAASALEKGEIDAFFCTAGAPTNAISELAARTAVRLVPIDPAIRENIMRMYPGYTRCTIPAGTYRGQQEDVETVGVKAVLVATAGMKAPGAAYIARFLQESGDKLQYAVGAVAQADLAYAVEDIPCAFHEGAAGYYASQGVTVDVASAVAASQTPSAQNN